MQIDRFEVECNLRQLAIESLHKHVPAMFVKGKGQYWVNSKKALEESPWFRWHVNDRLFVMIDFDGFGRDHWKKLPIKPNIVCYNPKNGNHQCYWILEVPVGIAMRQQRRKLHTSTSDSSRSYLMKNTMVIPTLLVQ
ncbi:hypothetical protein BCU49_019255 [Vibrio breoganii]